MKILETERLVLRPWTQSDLEDLYDYAKDPRVGPNAGWKPHDSLEESKKVLNLFLSGEEVYAIFLKEAHKVIGSIGLHERYPDDNDKTPLQREIGYVLSPDYWGRGIMPEAVEAMIAFAFEEVHVNILWCLHYDFNTNSKRVIDKSGFVYTFAKEDILTRLDNRKVNTMVYKITRDDYYKSH